MEKISEKPGTERFVTNAVGKKISVIVSFRRYRRLMEDLHDLAVIAERRDEQSIPFSDLEKKLRKDGRI